MLKDYSIRYTIEPGEWNQADIESGYSGLSDSMMVCSVVEEKEGISYVFMGINGKNKVFMDDNDFFKVWFMLASKLSESDSLENNKKKIAIELIKTVQSMMLSEL